MDDIPSHSSRKSSNTSSSSTSSSWKTPKTEFASPRHTSYRRPPHQIRTNKPKSKSRSRSPSPPISVKHTTLTESRSQSSVASSPLAAQLNAFLHSSSSSSSSCMSPITTTATAPDNTKPKSPSLISEYLKKQRLHKRTLSDSNESSEKRRDNYKKASQCQEKTADVYKDILLSKIAQSKSKMQATTVSSTNNVSTFTTEPDSLANQELDAIYDGQDD